MTNNKLFSGVTGILKSVRALLWGGLFCFFAASPVVARIIKVPEEHRTIQGAIDVSDKGDSIVVAPGIYYENIVLRDGRNLVGSGAEKTIITDDEQGAPDPVVQIDGDCLLEGFTITGARGAGVGHAVMIIRGAPRIVDNIVRDNSYTGIGIHSETHLTDPLITRNAIFGNGGAGVANLGAYSKAIIRDNDIYDNTNAGVACTDSAMPLVENNRLYGNGVGLASKEEAKPIVKNNLIYRNKLVGLPVVKGGRAVVYKNEITQNATVGINVDGKSQAWIVDNRVGDNGTEGVSVKSGSEAYLAFNKISSNVAVTLQVRQSTVTAVKNRIYCIEGMNVSVPTDYLLDQGIEVDHIRELTSYGPGVVSVHESVYAGGGNILQGKIDVDAMSRITEIPPEDLPADPSGLKMPDFSGEYLIAPEAEVSSQWDKAEEEGAFAERGQEAQPSEPAEPRLDSKPRLLRGCLGLF